MRAASRPPYDQPPFREVLLAARAGDGWAYECLFEAHRTELAAFLRARRAEDPDGVTNEVFLRAFRSLETFSGDARQFRAWLFAITRNLIIDEQRRQHRRPMLTLVAEPPPTASPEDVAQSTLDRLDNASVSEILDQLTEEQREVVLLRILGGLTAEEVAAVLNKRAGAIRAQQRRAVLRLRKLLRQRRPGGADEGRPEAVASQP